METRGAIIKFESGDKRETLPKVIKMTGRVKDIEKREEIRENATVRSSFNRIIRKSPDLYMNFDEMRHPSMAKNDKSRDVENIL